MALNDHQATFLEWLDANESAKICEVGCGTGAILRTLVRGSQRTGLGIDPDPRLIRAARFLSRHSASQLTFCCGYAQELPLDDSVSDATFAFAVLQLVPDIDAAIAEMFRVTRSYGRVMVAHPVEEIRVPTDPDLAGVEADIARQESSLLEGFQKVVTTRMQRVTSASTGAILAALRARSVTPIRIRGLFLPCSEQDMDRPEYERYCTRLTRQRALWAQRLAREAHVEQVKIRDLLKAYWRTAEMQIATRRAGRIGTLWSSPPLLVFIGSAP